MTPAVVAFVRAAGDLVAAGIEAHGEIRAAVAAVAGAAAARELDQIRQAYDARIARAKAGAGVPEA